MNGVIKLTWKQVRHMFLAFNDLKTINGPLDMSEILEAVVVFKPSNWPGQSYSLESRSYKCNSENKCFKSYCIGRSCYAASLDGSDPRCDIAKYDWEIDYCYLPNP